MTDLKQLAERLLNEAVQKIIQNTISQAQQHQKQMLASLDPATKLPLCDTCRLPKQLDPPLAPKVRGTTTEPSSSIQLCERRPWARRPGYDIYDNPFPKADATARQPTKKEREAAKAKAVEGTPASEEAQNGTGPPSPSENGGEQSTRKGEKKASKIDEKLKNGTYVPWQTCPSCKRSLLITRFAKHLEQCMGLSGRQASRNVLLKMSATPGGSRAGTPVLANGSQENGNDEDGEGSVKGAGSMKKKLLKKGVKLQMKKEKMNGKVNTDATLSSASKRPPVMNPASRHSPAPSSVDKRDRDEMLLGDDGEEDDSAIRSAKRQKFSRVGSTASLVSASGSVLERRESLGSSFVDGDEGEGGSLVDE
ncbi:hypothetical protein LTR62_002265 [Meristemomyces frigidus]|uniref:SAGA-associated factor 11 n=1 Tax=Meristemomyces frigidus TaxID=1508187 RepID=A0AAN7TRN4_9PEZI|nr:hypothetical protein LTR62_002265 [Meristemomyces frigidus]